MITFIHILPHVIECIRHGRHCVHLVPITWIQPGGPIKP